MAEVTNYLSPYVMAGLVDTDCTAHRAAARRRALRRRLTTVAPLPAATAGNTRQALAEQVSGGEQLSNRDGKMRPSVTGE